MMLPISFTPNRKPTWPTFRPTVSQETYAGVTPTSLGIGGGPSIAVVHASR